MTHRLGLVLGAGGTVGMAYHAGVLRALSGGGLDPGSADLVVGTSAGSVIGAYLRSGWTTDDMWGFAMGTHPTLADLDDTDLAARRRAVFTHTWASPVELARRGVGSAFVMARSVMRTPLPPAPALLRRAFPGGLFAMVEGERRFAEELPAEWPDEPLWLSAVDIESGRRVVLGRPGSPECTLAQGVLASCAIPGVYRPVRVAGMTLVDGGAHSTTNLDLASRFGCDVIVCVAPMAYDPSAPPDRLRQLMRRFPSRALAAETTRARREGAEVLLIRPTAAELRLHGGNLMNPDVAEQVARAAYEEAARLLDTDRFRRTLADLAA